MNNSHTMKKAFLLSLIILAFGGISKAQKDSVVLIKANEPTISDAFKINDNPRINDTTVEKLNLNYHINPKLYPTTFDVDPIKPAKMTGEPLVKLYRAFIKAGFGTKTTPLAEIDYDNLRSTTSAFGFYYDHLSSSGKIKNYGYPGFSDNKAGVDAKRFYRQHTFTADIDYTRNVVHYYGFNKNVYDTLPDYPNLSKKDSIKQRFAKIGGKFNFFSTYKDSTKLNHAFSLQYYHLSDLYNASENYINFSASADEKVNFLGRTVKNQNLGLAAMIDDYDDVNKTDTGNAAVIQFVPHFSAKGDIIKFNMGFNTSISTGKSSITYLYPDLSIDFNLYNNIFILYGGLTGGLQRNNLIDFSAENPFINTSLPLEFTNTKTKLFGGFKGSLSSKFSFDASVYDATIDNMPLFVNDTSKVSCPLQNKFTVVYDNVQVFNSHIELAFQKSTKINVALSADYFQYTTTRQLKAWHQPSSDVCLSFNYNLRDKIILKADVFARGSSYARTFAGNVPEATSLKGVVDFNLGMEYRYSKIWSAFINFNNVAAVRYQQWYNYPNYGFTALVGLTYSF